MMTSSITSVQGRRMFKYVSICAVVCLTHLYHQELRQRNPHQLISQQWERRYPIPIDYSKLKTGQETNKNGKQILNQMGLLSIEIIKMETHKQLKIL